MDDGIFQLFDETADRVVSGINMVLGAIDGVYARVYRQDPTPRGLRTFMVETEKFPDLAVNLSTQALDDFRDATLLYRTAFDPESPGNHETFQIALQQLRTLTETLRLASARRFRAALVARSSIAPPVVGQLRVLNRVGQQVKVNDAVYLLARKAAIDLFNEAQIGGLRSEGHRIAMVHTLNPEHAINGAVFSIDGSLTGLPHYLDLQDKWFHPRSNAVIVSQE